MSSDLNSKMFNQPISLLSTQYSTNSMKCVVSNNKRKYKLKCDVLSDNVLIKRAKKRKRLGKKTNKMAWK